MERQLAQDKDPVANPEEQPIISPPVGQSTNGPAAMLLASEEAREASAEAFTLTPQPIHFTNGNKAQFVYPPPETGAQAMVAALGLKKPEMLLLIAEGTTTLNEEVKSHLVQLFSRSLARTAAETRTMIIDEGRQNDLTGITGRGVADRSYKSVLVGITEAAKVTHPDLVGGAGGPERVALEPHHSHFILLAEAEKRPESEVMAQVAALLAGDKPVVTILAGGGALAKDQVIQSVRQNWPLLIIKGTGGLADEITTLWQQRPRPFIADPELAEIISEGKLYFFELKDSIEGFGHLLKWLSKPHPASDYATLELVWSRFGMYDEAAKRQQRYFRVMQNWILILGVAGTLLALIQHTIKAEYVTAGVIDPFYYTSQGLFYLLFLIPITVSLLIAAANRFNAGNKWIALRATAESIKKEIYLYRAHADAYSAAETTKTSRETKLVRKLDALSSKLMQSEVNVSASKPYKGAIPPQYAVAGGDDGFSFLTPDRYLTYRVQDQLDWYHRKTVGLERRLQRMQWMILIFGATGTLLVGIGLELWIALTTSLVASLTTYLEYQQVESTLIRYNQSANDLANILSWWTALSPAEKADPQNINKLVGQTETVIHSEHAAWVKEQQEAMAELRAAQAEQEGGQNANRVANLAAGQAQRVKESFATLSDFLEDAPLTSPQAQQVKEGIQSLAAMVESESLSPEQAVQLLDQVATRDELVEVTAAKPVKDAQTQDSLSILASLLDNTRLDMSQVEQTLKAAARRLKIVGGDQIDQALARLPDLIRLLEQEEASPEQIAQLIDSLGTLSILLEDRVLRDEEIERALHGLALLVALLDEQKGEFRPQKG